MNYKHYGKDELLGSDKESLTTMVKPMMNLEDAARHVSILTGKQTTKTDILMLANYNQLRLYARKASNNRDPLFAWIEIEFENDNLQEMLYLGLTQDFDYIELNYSDSIYIRDRGWLEKSLTKTIIRNLAGFYSIISTNTPSFAKTLAAKLSNGENVGVRCSETFCLAPKLMVEELLGEALPIVDFPVLFKVSYGDYFENLRKFQFDKIKFYESDIFVSHLDLSYYMYSEVEDFKNESEGKSKRKPSKAKLHTLKAVLLATDVYLKTKADNFVDAKNKDDWINEQFKIYGDPYEEELNNLEDNKNEVQIYAIKIEKLEDKYRLLLKQQLDEIIKQLPKSRKKIYSQCHDHLLPFYNKAKAQEHRFNSITNIGKRNTKLLQYINDALKD